VLVQLECSDEEPANKAVAADQKNAHAMRQS
jgi:hypothetical protein